MPRQPSYHLKGRTACDNRQYLPMELTDRSVLDTFRVQLLDPTVIERGLQKLERRPSADTEDDARVKVLEADTKRVRTEITRLTDALAAGGNLSALLGAVREREQRLEALASDLARARAAAASLDFSVDVVMSEVHHRLADWQAVLAQESTQTRQMLRKLLRGRLVFTPDLEANACEFVGEGDPSEIFTGLVTVPKALASPTCASWNLIGSLLVRLDGLRRAA